MTDRTTIGSLEPAAGAPVLGDIVDRTEPCIDCAAPFLMTCGEQLYYRERGYREPGRCPVCRAERRAERNTPLLTALQAQDAAGTSPEAVYGGANGADSRKGRMVLYPAVCASCGKETQVPFLPRGDRPVYCRECFGQRRGRR